MNILNRHRGEQIEIFDLLREDETDQHFYEDEEEDRVQFEQDHDAMLEDLTD